MSLVYDVIIVGGGPAGLSAAVFTARAGMRTLVLDGGDSSVQRALLNNYLGFPEGILGTDFRSAGLRHAERAGAEVQKARVLSVARLGDGFRVSTEDGEFDGRYLVLATGKATDLAAALGAEVVERADGKGVCFRVDGQGRTGVPGVWAAGVAAGTTSHVIVAAGDGARVAINLLSEVTGKRHVDHDVPRVAEVS